MRLAFITAFSLCAIGALHAQTAGDWPSYGHDAGATH